MASSAEKRTTQDQLSVAKKSKTENVEIHINEEYTKSAFEEVLADAFSSETKEITFENGAKILNDPFTCCILPNFIQPSDNLEKIKEDIDEIDVELKVNDLYQFKQSGDLANCIYPGVKSLRELLYGECLEWLKKITKIPLTDKVDMSCSCYTYTDHLLCHDDELEGRRIAYIYYLVPEWEENDGGTLDLFKSENGQPSDIVKSLLPTLNNFVFFEVSPVSYHQVSEVLSFKTRTSISGWFHGPPIKKPQPFKEIISYKEPLQTAVDIESWINHAYLDADTQESIRESFEESSEIELMTFIQEDKYKEICKALNDNKLEWTKVGPPCRRNYKEAKNFEQMPILKELDTLFCSEDFLLLLSHLTGLRLCHTEADDSFNMPEISTTMRQWSHGSYILLHDESFATIPTLNSTLYLNFTKWDTSIGGYTSYVAEEENEELLRVDPKPNSLALVYITEGTSSFVKYLNKKSVSDNVSNCFYDIFALYKER